MKANDLFSKELKNNHNINKICIDSREVTNNDIFFCINAFEYIPEAILRGAKTICMDQRYQYSNNYPNINFIIFEDIKLALGIYIKKLNKDLYKDFIIIGITGTNGKTTISTLLHKYLRSINKGCTLIGSNGATINDDHFLLANTTPNIVKVYEILKESKRNKIKYVVMEVSSHGIKELRIYGLHFQVVAFTNLTQDHLDYHKTMDDYLYTKLLFLSSIGKKGSVILNKDDPSFSLFTHYIPSKIVTYGQKQSDYCMSEISLTDNYSYFILKVGKNNYPIKTNLLGLFNLYNIACFYAILSQLNLLKRSAYNFFEKRIEISGRMNVIEKNNRKVIIDFAHTPNGVFNVLDFLNQVKKNRLIVVIGCGGNRDREKRPIMGDIASKYADFVIFTSDNPREEDPSRIIDEMLEGVKNETNYYKIVDRKDAIFKAITISNPYDTICILGKGSERFIISNDKYIPFSDYDYALEVLNKGVI